MPAMTPSQPAIGVAITTYCAAGFIGRCLASLRASQGVRLKVVVVDNCSPDMTCEAIRAWAAEHLGDGEFAEGTEGMTTAWLTLLRAPVNGGFARGTNMALRVLLADPGIALFWLLNPDCEVNPGAALAYARAGADGNFALMGGRTVFAGRPGTIQSDGGRVSRLTGRCVSVNARADAALAPPPDAATLDYFTGANCVASRRFVETCGLLPEEYFLFYEEVDWALRRGSLPLRYVPGAVVRHVGGSAIGTGTIERRSSPLAAYFSFRNRIRFVRRWNPLAQPLALASGLAHPVRLAAVGDLAQAHATLAGVLQFTPPHAVRQLIASEARRLAFGADG
ncbi:glycosyltransferase family 2 protein [Altererythrobacter sp. BO-6]|uniref:glycosyltransferase family 2 protein n=1 Tax=Altererythrobacter sp. BO-6 TaxID=2604537 RepID=UPI0013E13DC5|nr:glycosyltransferase family 2 protein [Altererythrobacter sp. BO-6]QIG54015.1 glycosyltransferase family 2 protein [Altererythrobacter sp. BO-6]